MHVLAEVAIGDLTQFLEVFGTQGAQARKRHGSQGAQVFRVQGETGRVMVLLQWESEAAFDSFRNDASVRETMKSGGMMGPPRFTLLQVAGTFAH